jgi:alpha-glucuronidase
MDRTVATGTGFIGQYQPPVAAMFESLATCPDDLLLFMHHVPYTHELRSGKTVIQHFYDTHYQGADAASGLVSQWQKLRGRIDEQRFNEVLQRLEYQAAHAQVWRDAICRWFQQRSGIQDELGRVGTYPNRFEAEDGQLDGYQVTEIVPWEAASGSQGVQLIDHSTGSVRFRYNGSPGSYELRIQCFDEEDGVSHFKVYVGERLIDQWQADQRLPTPTTLPDAHSSIRRAIRDVALQRNDEIRIEGSADDGERAGIDYIEIIAGQRIERTDE